MRLSSSPHRLLSGPSLDTPPRPQHSAESIPPAVTFGRSPKKPVRLAGSLLASLMLLTGCGQLPGQSAAPSTPTITQPEEAEPTTPPDTSTELEAPGAPETQEPPADEDTAPSPEPEAEPDSPREEITIAHPPETLDYGDPMYDAPGSSQSSGSAPPASAPAPSPTPSAEPAPAEAPAPVEDSPAEPAAQPMSFEKAMAPYTNESYDFNGFVRKDGTVANGGLGCSGFTSAVLQRMRYGENWLEQYDHTAHQVYGHEFAERFDLPLVAKLDTATLRDPAAIQAKIQDQTLEAEGLYYFNVRNGVNGHTGFVRVKSNGTLEQFQYTGLKAYNGLATGNILDWYTQTHYRQQPLELYKI